MIHLVVALPAEAEPLIERLRLRRDPAVRSTRLYVGEAIRLVVSGVGKQAAAAAVTALRQSVGAESAWWVNVGIAAHRFLALGQLVAARRIIDAGDGRCWETEGAGRWDLPQATVATVDRPQRALADDRLYDMEAAGFAAALADPGALRRVACFKTVSDHGVESPGQLTAAEVGDLIRRNLGRLEALLLELGRGSGGAD